jgi:CTP:molybdopterin cytidylyltransferase MocA
MLVAAIAAAVTVAGPIYVVTGAHAELVKSMIADLPAPLKQQLAGRLHTLHNPRWASGQASSLHVSLRNLPGDVEAAIWMPVDQPYLDPALLSRLVAAWRSGADLAAPQVNGELRGAPALFDRRHWPELLEVQGDSGGRSVLRRHRANIAAIATPEASLRDIDSPLDLT